jgi:hypothetical protein
MRVADEQTGRMDTLGRVIADLDLLNRTTERDFLRIGGKLGEFIETVNVISSDLAALASCVSGEHGPSASGALTAALDRSLEMEARYATGGGDLDGMRQEVRRLRQTLADYRRTVSTFRAIGFLTRIEIARVGAAAADFGNLTDDVKCLAENVQERVQSALDSAARLIPSIESAAVDISAVKEGQLKDLPSLIAAVSEGLSSFQEMQDRTHASSVRLGARYESISQAFAQLIVSIQFHDITRQQVEHVIEVLRRLCSESQGENAGAVGEQPAAGAVLALQSSQLCNAQQKFAASVEALTSNLGEISDHVSKIADESRELFSDSADEKDSVLVRMEAGCTAILARLSHCAGADAAARATSGAMTETIARMRASIEEIRAIEIQMFHVATNARINANRLGPAGEPLDVLANSMGQQAFESRQRSESLVEDLDSMREAAIQLSGREAPGDSGQDECAEGMRAAVAELQALHGRSLGQIPQVIACADRLRENLSATREGFSVGALFAEGIGRARATLNRMGGENPSALSPDGRESPERGLEDFTMHYTMQAERDVHENVMGTAPTGGAAPRPLEPAAEEDEGQLGENVEFF